MTRRSLLKYYQNSGKRSPCPWRIRDYAAIGIWNSPRPENRLSNNTTYRHLMLMEHVETEFMTKRHGAELLVVNGGGTGDRRVCPVGKRHEPLRPFPKISV